MKSPLSPGGHTATPLLGDTCAPSEFHPLSFHSPTLFQFNLYQHTILSYNHQGTANLMWCSLWPFLTRHPSPHTHILHYLTSKLLTEVLLKAWEWAVHIPTCVDIHMYAVVCQKPSFMFYGWSPLTSATSSSETLPEPLNLTCLWPLESKESSLSYWDVCLQWRKSPRPELTWSAPASCRALEIWYIFFCCKIYRWY